MSDSPRCGCPVPIVNPPILGTGGGSRLPLRATGLSVEVPYPVDPSFGFPRVLTLLRTDVSGDLSPERDLDVAHIARRMRP
jgi:hypothetical protein